MLRNTPNRLRPLIVNFRANHGERAYLHAAARRHGTTLSALIRTSLQAAGHLPPEGRKKTA